MKQGEEHPSLCVVKKKLPLGAPLEGKFRATAHSTVDTEPSNLTQCDLLSIASMLRSAPLLYAYLGCNDAAHLISCLLDASRANGNECLGDGRKRDVRLATSPFMVS